LAGLSALPNLQGYVATTPKGAAQLVLVSHLDDPVLTVWQYGLGRVAAWTSDALGLWTANWLTWSDAARWWANLVTWTLPTPDSALNVHGNVVGGSGHLIVDIPSSPVSSSGGQQQVQARIVAPDLSPQTVSLQPTAPERWEGNFPATQVGAYILQVLWHGSTVSQGGPSVLTTTTGLVVPYSPEFHMTGTDTRFLNLLAQDGGGSTLDANNTGAAFSQNLVPVTASLPIAFLLLALAALLLPIDVAVRRLASLEFLTLGYRWLITHLAFKRIHASTPSRSQEEDVGTPLGATRAKREERRNRTVVSPRSLPDAPKQVETPVTPAQKIQSTQSEVSTAEKLLEAKRKRSQANKTE